MRMYAEERLSLIQRLVVRAYTPEISPAQKQACLSYIDDASYSASKISKSDLEDIVKHTGLRKDDLAYFFRQLKVRP